MSSRLLVVVIVLQSLTLLGQWTSSTAVIAPAHAGDVPDSLNQKSQMVDELRTLNGKMDKLIGLLESGNLQVKVATPDENKQAKSAK